MEASKGKTLRDNELGYQLFKFFLLAAGIFSAIEAIRNSLDGANEIIAAVMSVILVGLYFIVQKFPRSINTVLVAMYVTTLIGTIIAFVTEGGMYSRAPFLLITGFVIYIIFFNNAARIVSIAILLLITVALIYFQNILPIDFTGKEVVKNSDTSFLVFLIFISVFIMFIKSSLFKSRRQMKQLNKELKKNNRQLHIQSKELFFNQNEIEQINNNLENRITKRLDEIEAKNKEISEFAFVNAHLLRAPLTRILGLTYLIEMNDSIPPDSIKQIQIKAEETDKIVKKIAKVLN